jgi:Zn-dependent protease
VNPANYRDHVWGDVRVSLAGVVSNMGLAVLATLASVAVLKLEAGVGPLGGVTAALSQMALYGIVINVVLATFNLIPIPPLDGSHVLYHALPARLAVPYQRSGRYGILVLMGLMFLAPGAFRLLMWPVGALVGAADAFIRLWT